MKLAKNVSHYQENYLMSVFTSIIVNNTLPKHIINFGIAASDIV